MQIATSPGQPALPATSSARTIRRRWHAGSVPGMDEQPTLLNGATIHGRKGTSALRHPAEMPLVYACVVVTVLVYAAWIAVIVWLAQGPSTTGLAGEVRSFFTDGGTGAQLLLVVPALPVLLWIGRALMYAQQRAMAVQMGPTQFPEAYRMVVEAANAFGLRKVPDAYVVLGNGQVNAFAAGHGFRRYVVVYSDLFEIGGSSRDPEALRFVISHEVGHLAAGHVSYTRLLLTTLAAQVPLLGPALSRAQEYTADNHGYAIAPRGVPGVIGLLTAGKYLGAHVNLHAVADRATRERDLWLHLVVWGASHPVSTWRAHALRDRSRPGRLMLRPPATTAWFPPVQPAGTEASGAWPSPPQVLAHLDAVTPRVDGGEQFGRYPGVEYPVPRDAVRLADPTPAPRTTLPPAVPPEALPQS